MEAKVEAPDAVKAVAPQKVRRRNTVSQHPFAQLVRANLLNLGWTEHPLAQDLWRRPGTKNYLTAGAAFVALRHEGVL